MTRAQGSGLRAQGAQGAQVLVLAPNWLGDAVLALPAIADVRRAYPAARVAVAGRRSVAEIFRLVPWIDEVIALESDARWWRRAGFRADVDRLRPFDVALLLPNSFQSAWMIRAAGVAERWGYAADLRSPLLTRAVPREKGGHQAEFYQRLTGALGIATGQLEPAIDVPRDLRAEARALLAAEGHAARAAVVTLAPGAAYGRAKQWIPAHVAALVARLAREEGASCVLVGSRADASTAAAIRTRLPALEPGRVIDLCGRTTLPQLAGVLAESDACVCNDSGAMHLAAAVGTHVVATFGPTNERATRPLPRDGRGADVLTHAVWCRPCMLRECPIDHRCMRGITPDRVFSSLVERLPR
jgi:heptosyltransferase-2